MNYQFIKANPLNNYNKYLLIMPYKISLIMISIVNTLDNKSQNAKKLPKKRQFITESFVQVFYFQWLTI